jgi:predicted NUDIX family NTP pyrophosphohydrolase
MAPAVRSELATVLFTDVAGSTDFTLVHPEGNFWLLRPDR